MKRLQGEQKNLDGFSVTRCLPHKEQKMVGPFIFIDRMGPAQFQPGQGVNVRPHPHIGLATLTYLFAGSMLHRDSLGNVQEIFPGEVNWMTAGRGIVHSERETLEVRSVEHCLDGLQLWLALPPEYSEIQPAFQHCCKAELPHRYQGNTYMRLVAGEAYGMTSPVRTYMKTFFVDIVSAAGEQIELPDGDEVALYVQQGEILVGDDICRAGEFVVLSADEVLLPQTPARCVLLGGERYAKMPHIRWNFVAYNRDRIAQAESDWQQGRFATIPGDDDEFTPLPG